MVGSSITVQELVDVSCKPVALPADSAADVSVDERALAHALDGCASTGPAGFHKLRAQDSHDSASRVGAKSPAFASVELLAFGPSIIREGLHAFRWRGDPAGGYFTAIDYLDAAGLWVVSPALRTDVGLLACLLEHADEPPGAFRRAKRPPRPCSPALNLATLAEHREPLVDFAFQRRGELGRPLPDD